MRRIAYMAIGVAASAAILFAFAGCGSKTGDVPGTVATVNGTAISSSDYVRYMSAQTGRRVLSNLIEENLVMQWAKEENVEPTEDQVNRQIESFKREGIYDEQAKQIGEEFLKDEVRAMQAKANLVKKFDKIGDAEVEQAYNGMRDRYVHGPRKQISMIVNADKAKIDEAAKMLAKGDDFDTVAASQSDARFLVRGAAFKTWVDETQQGLPEAIVKAAKETASGKTSPVFTINQPGQPVQHAILKVVSDLPKANFALKDVKDEITDMLAWQKSMSSQIFVEKFNERKKKANIEINMPQFKDITSEFKNPPPPPPAMSMPQPAPPQAAPKAPAAPKK